MQKLSQQKKQKNQTPEDRLKEIRDEITELQKEHKAKTVSEAKTKYGIDHIDTMDDPASFREWCDLETEYNDMLEKLVGGWDSV